MSAVIAGLAILLGLLGLRIVFLIHAAYGQPIRLDGFVTPTMRDYSEALARRKLWQTVHVAGCVLLAIIVLILAAGAGNGLFDSLLAP